MTQVELLAKLGTSVWLDDLSRDSLDSGTLREIIDTTGIVGVTTNPAIFASAMSKGNAYDQQLAELKAQGMNADEAVYEMAIQDVRNACDQFSDIYEASNGQDGRVSIEVDPRLFQDKDATLAQARQLYERVGRENVMIKIPASLESLPAVTEALAEGISVNVTLIFSVARYREVVGAFIDGINRAHEKGLDISKIHSVASFFVSRVDTEIDKRLDAIGTPEALDLKGKAGLANAHLAYAAFEDLLLADNVLPAGANVQRPLWASTGVKNPDYPATMYVSELAGPHTVNTMPEATLRALLDSDVLHGDTLSGRQVESEELFAKVLAAGVDTEDVFRVLEQEGVDKFIASWSDLLISIEGKLA
ncbi:transaldolase [Corynebacterium sp. H127]|uniref:transaldolase n=1 Tax=Corynebacterium sp. H127 TaxID=3133418 RepID=UPI0030B4A51E